MLLKSEIIFTPEARFYVSLDQVVQGFEHYQIEVLVEGELTEVCAFNKFSEANIHYESTVKALKLRVGHSA